MRRFSRLWRDDRLGSALRLGLGPYRRAEPSDAVWRRIASEIEPKGHDRSVSFSRATMLSVLLLLGMAVTGLGAELNGESARQWSVYGRLDNLTAIDLAVASRASAPGPWDTIMPEAPRSVSRYTSRVLREAFNRPAWQRTSSMSSGGPVAPLSLVNGQ